ncbi:hypothetical protein NDU88_003734 [Pleurodeles waltl]|uniref:Uncharacterized protein n=1 Tax=Pleurodeles waltl TaxID=8319 RepID=A0AAV7VGN0_PLEWA|nr:hypothetical protein NDU88_003734 [Pleurodeles waltl]
MLAKTSQGLRDSVPGTFPPGGPKDEPRTGAATLGLLNLNWQGKPPPSPVDSQPLHGAAHWEKRVPTPGPGEALSRLMNSSMLVRPPWAVWDPIPGALPHGGLEDEAQDRGSHSNPWPSARMGPLSMTWQGKPPQVSPAIWTRYRNAKSTTRCPWVSERPDG